MSVLIYLFIFKIHLYAARLDWLRYMRTAHPLITVKSVLIKRYQKFIF